MAFIRPRQRSVTALFPHQGNRRFIVPKRGKGSAVTPNPGDLFDPDTPGVFYNMADMSTLFQDSDGITPVGAYGDPVGLRIDQSQGGESSLGPDVSQPFVNLGDGWTDNGDGTYSCDGTQAASSIINTAPGAAEVGTAYRNTFELVSRSAGAVAPIVGGSVSLAAFNVAGTYTTRQTAMASTQTGFNANPLFVGTVRPIAVNEIPGTHEYQPTATARGIYSRHPKSTVRNLLDNSDGLEQFLAQAGCTVVVDGGTGPTGKPCARVTFNGAVGEQFHTALATASTSGLQVALRLISGSSAGLNIGTRTANLVPVAPTSTWAVYSDLFNDSSNPRVYGDGATCVVDVANMQLELDAVTAYQSRKSAYDVTEEGVPDNFGLTYDGVDDTMVTTSDLDMSSTDEVTVVLGMHKTSDVAEAFVASFPGTSGYDGSFSMRAPHGAGLGSYRFAARGTVEETTAITGYASPVYSVVTGTAKISTPSVILRVDGAQRDEQTQSMGTGMFGSWDLYSGDREGFNRPFTGTIYSDLVIGRLLTAEELRQTEFWFADNTPGVTL